MKHRILILLILTSLFSFSQEEKNEEKKVNFAFIPIVSYNKSFGAQVGLMSNIYYNINKNDTISPPSVVGLMGTYFINGTYFAGMFAKNYFNEDKWRTNIMYFNGNIEFQTFINFSENILPYLDEDGVFLDYNTKFNFLLLEGQRKVFNHFYLGLRLSYTHVRTEFEPEIIQIPITKQVDDLFGIGGIINYDTRDNLMNPKKGMNAKIATFSFLENLGSSSEYHDVEIQINKYFPLTKKSLIMLRYYSVISIGDVPFSGQNVIGRDDLRGYSNGKYRANQVYNIQTEYRWNFYNKWGLVTFGGLAIATNDFEGDKYSGILPAIGTGIRFLAIKSRNINIGIDAAVGKEDWGLYFRIGETFTR